MSNADASSAPAASSVGGKLFDTVLTSTPVVLTVLSTLLASQSTTEMSFAQYHRSMAAQNQSKASDQWQFFQAKRIRGAAFETSLDLLATAGVARVDLDTLTAESNRLVEEMAGLERDFRRHSEMLAGFPGIHEMGAPSRQVAEAAKAGHAAVAKEQKKLAAALRTEAGAVRPEVEITFRYLNPPYPRIKDGKFEEREIQEALEQLRAKKIEGEGKKLDFASMENPALVKVVKAVRRRATEAETLADVEKIDRKLLVEAIKTAEADADAFDEWSRPGARTVESLQGLVREEAAAVRAFLRKVEPQREAVLGLPEKTEGMRVEAAALVRRLDALGRSAEQLVRDFASARQSFTAWRYEVDARYNQRSAELFEIQVRKSSEESDTHMKRSWGYFYAMLAVQASVTIATLALAVRQKSVLWSLASLASLLGVGYAMLIFLNMPVPVPGV